MDHANTASTVLNEQSQNPSQAGSASTSMSKDVGKNMGQETSSAGGGLDARMDQADMARTGDFGAAKGEERGVAMKVGREGGGNVDAHEAAAGKQP